MRRPFGGPLLLPSGDSVSPGEEYNASTDSAEVNVGRSVAKLFGDMFYFGKVDGVVPREAREGEQAHFLNSAVW